MINKNEYKTLHEYTKACVLEFVKQHWDKYGTEQAVPYTSMLRRLPKEIRHREYILPALEELNKEGALIFKHTYLQANVAWHPDAFKDVHTDLSEEIF